MPEKFAAGGYTVGLVGAGGIASVHLPAWLALGVDVVIFSTAGAAALIKRHRGGTEVSSLEQLLASCDVVDVCTPTYVHAEVVRLAAAAGRQVLCEKPLARTSADAATMIAACSAAGVQLYPGHVVRYFPEFEAMHRAVVAGTVGSVAVQRFSRTGSRPDPGWFADDVLSGGIVLDQSIHDFDFARWNAGEVVTVFSREARSAAARGVRGAQTILTHGTGAISYVSGTWAKPGTTFRTTFEIAGTNGLIWNDSRQHPPLVLDHGMAVPAGDHGMAVPAGDHGMAVPAGDHGMAVPAGDHGNSDLPGTGLLPATPFVESPYLTEIREISAAFQGGPPPRVSADDGLQAVRIGEAAIESLRTGQPVELAPEHTDPAATRERG